MPLPPPVLRAVLRRPLRHTPRPSSRRPQSSKDTTCTSSSKTKTADDPIPVPSTLAPLPLWQRLGPLTRAAEGYARAQRTRPYTTQIASAVFIFLCADLSSQKIAGNEYDPVRSGRSMIIGAVAAIPQYRWFFFLARNFNYASRVLSIGTKIVVSQLLFTPLFNTYFFGSQVLLAGHGIDATIERVKGTVPTSFVNSCKFWPVVTVFTLTSVPLEFRAVFSGVIAIGWQTYLTYLNRQAEIKERKLAKENAMKFARV